MFTAAVCPLPGMAFRGICTHSLPRGHCGTVESQPARADTDRPGGVLAVIQEVIDPLHDQIGKMSPAEDSELARLNRAVPPGPISLFGTLTAGMDVARGALDHIGLVLTTPDYHPTAVLHPLMRAALIGAARIVTPLL